MGQCFVAPPLPCRAIMSGGRGPHNYRKGRRARLQVTPREGPESGRNPSFHYECEIA